MSQFSILNSQFPIRVPPSFSFSFRIRGDTTGAPKEDIRRASFSLVLGGSPAPLDWQIDSRAEMGARLIAGAQSTDQRRTVVGGGSGGRQQCSARRFNQINCAGLVPVWSDRKRERRRGQSGEVGPKLSAHWIGARAVPHGAAKGRPQFSSSELHWKTALENCIGKLHCIGTELQFWCTFPAQRAHHCGNSGNLRAATSAKDCAKLRTVFRTANKSGH